MIRIVRLGTERLPAEGVRIGTVRRPPRSVPKAEYARRNFYDVWLPDLAPSAQAIADYHKAGADDTAWWRLERRYRAEMKEPGKARLLGLLAALSQTTNFSVGCYCENERRCHRSILRSLLRAQGATLHS